MIISEEKFKKDNSEEAYAKLCSDFNSIAGVNKSKFKMEIIYGYPQLLKSIIFNFGNSLGECQVHYNGDVFSFCGGIDRKTYGEVKPLLEKMKQKFEIEVVE